MALLDLLHQIPEVEIVGITDKDPAAPAFSAHGTSTCSWNRTCPTSSRTNRSV